ncbi:hypothetical protein [uncultured Pontibacter sp.]|uniref:hypothetical protein n=1 Tax=uncultured Pontibacter sp. TaxID=453356 RepID=UPI00262669E0|nr:hypothetical protein [uncultured Pontibacter sp.]
MQRTILSLLLTIFLSGVSCADKEQNQSDTGKESAYQEYREFVLATEQQANSNDQSSLQEWDGEVRELKESYLTHESRIMQYSDAYEPERREEIEELRRRYDAAIQKLQERHEDVSRRYQLRQEMLGIDVESDDLSEITTANLAATYQHFVNTLDQNKAQYSGRDWEMIEGWWNALQNRTKELAQSLSPADRSAIAESEKRYLQIRQSV